MPAKTAKAKTAKKSASPRKSQTKHKWSAAVTTDSTHPRKGLFNEDAPTIARELASKQVSPKGPASGMRMLTFYINRAGKNLPQGRMKVLEHAKELLHERVASARKTGKSAEKREKERRHKSAAA